MRMKTKTVMDQMNAEKPDDVLNDLEAKHGSRATNGSEAWIRCSDKLPPPDTDVETKIDDGKGVRNVCALRRNSNLWWFTDMSMYIYYSPTHWRPLPPNA